MDKSILFSLFPNSELYLYPFLNEATVFHAEVCTVLAKSPKITFTHIALETKIPVNRSECGRKDEKMVQKI